MPCRRHEMQIVVENISSCRDETLPFNPFSPHLKSLPELSNKIETDTQCQLGIELLEDSNTPALRFRQNAHRFR